MPITKAFSNLVTVIAWLLAIFVAPSVSADGIYWADLASGSIGRANLDGTGATDSFIPNAAVPNAGPDGVAVNATNIYWTTFSSIGRANLDGTGVNLNFIPGITNATGDVVVNGTYIFWAEHSFNTIGRANLDGTGVIQDLITLPLMTTSLNGLAVNGQYIYFGHDFDIGRANLDGTGVNPSFISAPLGAGAVAIDGNYIYWSQGNSGNGGAIARANLDGTGVRGCPGGC